MWTDPVAPLVFTPDARRILALALRGGDDDRILPQRGDDAEAIMGALADLELLEVALGGYVATDHLRNQAWAQELIDDPFPT